MVLRYFLKLISAVWTTKFDIQTQQYDRRTINKMCPMATHSTLTPFLNDKYINISKFLWLPFVTYTAQITF